MSKLAIFGGEPVRKINFPDQNTLGVFEAEALNRVVAAGRPSGYRANRGAHFFGGTEIQGLEYEWSYKFNAKYRAIAVNSATSGLFAACAAIGLKPGDEVIVTPYSMTCSATIPLWFGAKPVFADVEEKYFCIDPGEILELGNEKTKAIIAVDLFGLPCDYTAIKQVIGMLEARYKNKIYLITDTAQAPGAKYGNKYAGTIGDIGIFSLNFGKHMTCGEGGMMIVNDEDLSYRCRLIMNHAESVMNDLENENEVKPYLDMIGLNLRMTEFQAAVAKEQLKKLDWNIHERIRNVTALNSSLQMIPAITAAEVRHQCEHSYYVAAYLWDQRAADGLHRDKFIEAVKAELKPREGRLGEGVQIGCGYIKPIYLMPWNRNNEKPDCPVVESLWKDDLFLTLYHAPNSTLGDIKDVAEAFHKVWHYRKELM